MIYLCKNILQKKQEREIQKIYTRRDCIKKKHLSLFFLHYFFNTKPVNYGSFAIVCDIIVVQIFCTIAIKSILLPRVECRRQYKITSRKRLLCASSRKARFEERRHERKTVFNYLRSARASPVGVFRRVRRRVN